MLWPFRLAGPCWQGRARYCFVLFEDFIKQFSHDYLLFHSINDAAHCRNVAGHVHPCLGRAHRRQDRHAPWPFGVMHAFFSVFFHQFKQFIIEIISILIDFDTLHRRVTSPACCSPSRASSSSVAARTRPSACGMRDRCSWSTSCTAPRDTLSPAWSYLLQRISLQTVR